MGVAKSNNITDRFSVFWATFAWAAGLILLSLSGCATRSEVASTGMEKVAESDAQLTETKAKLQQADAQLVTFQENMKALREDLAKDQDDLTRDKTARTLARLDINVQEARADLKDLLAQNQAIARDFDRRLKNAAEASERLIEEGPSARDRRSSEQLSRGQSDGSSRTE